MLGLVLALTLGFGSTVALCLQRHFLPVDLHIKVALTAGTPLILEPTMAEMWAGEVGEQESLHHRPA